MIQFDHDFAKVKGNVFSNERMHQLELILSKESKKAKVDGKDILKISDYVGYLNAVVFVQMIYHWLKVLRVLEEVFRFGVI